MTVWYDRVSEKIKVLRDQEIEDKRLLSELESMIDDGKSRSDGEMIRRDLDGTTISKLLDHEIVFACRVEKGVIEVISAAETRQTNCGDEWRQYKDQESALNYMAELMAVADWKKQKDLDATT